MFFFSRLLINFKCNKGFYVYNFLPFSKFNEDQLSYWVSRKEKTVKTIHFNILMFRLRVDLKKYLRHY